MQSTVRTRPTESPILQTTIHMHITFTTRTTARQGSIYAAVLMVSLLISIMGAMAISVSRLEFRIAENHEDLQEAQVLARSAVEYAVNWIDKNPTWRNSETHDVATSPINFGNGNFAWKLVDADGVLNDDVDDAVELIGIGRVGEAVAAQRVLMEPTGEPLTCLEVALHCDADVTLNAGSTFGHTDVQTDQIISSGGNIDASASYAEIQGDAEAVGTITGNVTGSSASGLAVREMPHEHLFEYYLNNGTYIDITALPTVIGWRVIDRQVISPANNPWGTTNPEGIYVIDCQGEKISIYNSRIVGTIVLLNNDPISNTFWSMQWTPAVANYPTLLTENGFELKHSYSSLYESLTGTNFNPPGTPYEGDEDNDQTDEYPGVIAGLIYVGGTLKVDGSTPKTCGVVVTPSITLDSNVRFDYGSVHYNYPPPGFSKGTDMRIVPGSWRQVSVD